MCATKCEQPIDWVDFTNHDVNYHHIRCHQILAEREDIPLLVETLIHSEFALALVLINTDDNFDINYTLLPSDESLGFPILIVTSSTGKILKTAFKQHSRNTEARVELMPAEADLSITKPAAEDGHSQGAGLGLLNFIEFSWCIIIIAANFIQDFSIH